ncbi:hypothetical protein RW1_056_00160 [Rhodococcus wratislaviensis NBRC 100605]|uniref:NADP-dependent oxidoreductase domain-containing protein n=1 Tax=Rhodococcus wratislaviensis NBRC 100605 TaxID=1219028 RepID=X0PYE7_RHOWR|nr:aldo/keto reductase [Rhodococcus sp. JS3073]GAF48589.1 hypothetical protein RW1_056_00160 [Rhodococcus wratislaviensis NBRC 100605]
MGPVRRGCGDPPCPRAGVNFFDTAQAYGFGASERILGKALRHELNTERDEFVIATNGGLRRTDSGLVRDASPIRSAEVWMPAWRRLGCIGPTRLCRPPRRRVRWPN